MVTLALRKILRKRKKRGRRRIRRDNEKNNRRAIAEVELNLPNLPEEIIIEILSKLPLKSLIRSTLVSKQWRSLIQSGTVKKSVPRKKVLVGGRFFRCSIDEKCRVNRVRVPVKNIPSNCYIDILGSCNGLVLIRLRDDLFLWNPLTKCSKKVLSYHRLQDSDCGVVSGLCFDSSSNDYKAVVALSGYSPHDGSELVVGSFRSKSWTHIYFPYRVFSENSGPVLHENLHWFVSKNSTDQFLPPHQIVYFSPKTDRFKKFPMPQPRHEDGDNLLGLGVLEGCLCMVRCNGEHPNDCADGVVNVEVLAMKEYGKQESWTSMFMVSSLPELYVYYKLVPLCSTKNGEVLMTFDDQYIRAYNPNDNSQSNISQIAINDFDAVVYEESLVTPSDYNWEEEELRGEATYVEIFLSGSWKKMKKVEGIWKYVESSYYEESDSEEEDYEESELEENSDFD